MVLPCNDPSLLPCPWLRPRPSYGGTPTSHKRSLEFALEGRTGHQDRPKFLRKPSKVGIVERRVSETP